MGDQTALAAIAVLRLCASFSSHLRRWASKVNVDSSRMIAFFNQY